MLREGGAADKRMRIAALLQRAHGELPCQCETQAFRVLSPGAQTHAARQDY